MKEFNLEDHYYNFLKRIKADESGLVEIQRKEIKRSYMFVFSSLLIMLSEELSQMPEEKAVERLQIIYEQVTDFVRKEAQN